MPVGQQHCRVPAGPATLALHGWDRIDQREQSGDVVGVPLVSIAKLHLRVHARISGSYTVRGVWVRWRRAVDTHQQPT
jgi:hypothetical protein